MHLCTSVRDAFGIRRSMAAAAAHSTGNAKT
jgi:hypothetical protein